MAERARRCTAGFMLPRCSGERYFPLVDVLFQQQANWVWQSSDPKPVTPAKHPSDPWIMMRSGQIDIMIQALV